MASKKTTTAEESRERLEQSSVEEMKEVTPAVEIQSAAVESAATVEREQLIYIGPTVRKNGIGLRTNQVFVGGHPAYMKALYDEYPLIKQLFVPVDNLIEARKQIHMPGTALYTAIRSLKGV
ncbi:hypothetical protein [Paenibacillus phoenicis]|uniref:hypothetical protein n=1 Tax=Paenibacillus phoenicis TaxID=554117 RepID=UPI003D283E40